MRAFLRRACWALLALSVPAWAHPAYVLHIRADDASARAIAAVAPQVAKHLPPRSERAHIPERAHMYKGAYIGGPSYDSARRNFCQSLSMAFATAEVDKGGGESADSAYAQIEQTQREVAEGGANAVYPDPFFRSHLLGKRLNRRIVHLVYSDPSFRHMHAALGTSFDGVQRYCQALPDHWHNP